MNRRALVVAWAVSAALSLGCSRDLTLPPEPLPVSVTGCTGDAECTVGLCDENGQCDSSRCRTNEQCLNGLCRSDGRCADRRCEIDGDCGQEHYCSEQASGDSLCVQGCRDDGYCPAGKICSNSGGPTPGVCLDGACLNDSECGPCGLCEFDGNGAGTCSPQPKGPAVKGDPTSLTMRDNLAEAVAFVRAREPEAMLTQINGLSLKSNGTVDITRSDDYVSRWMYGFQVGDGSAAPPRFITMTYLLLGGSCGLYDGEATNLSLNAVVPDATWQTYKDSDELVSAFAAQSGCVAPAQASSDSLIYDQDGTPPRFRIGNWKNQFAIGNPVDGTFSNVSCP